MKNRFPTLAVLATLALGFGLSAQAGAAPAMNAPAAARNAPAADAEQPAAEQIGHRDRGRRQDNWRHHGGRNWNKDQRRHDQWRGQRQHRPRGGVYFHFGTPAPQFHHVPSARRSHVMPRSHVNWCHARYRSYRSWDNTFQPNRGPRRQCISPFV